MEQNDYTNEKGCTIAAFLIVWLGLLAGLYFISQFYNHDEDTNIETQTHGASL